MTSSIVRISRRSLLTDFGAAGVGLIVLGACAGSSDSASDTTAVEASNTTAGEPSTTASTAPASTPTTGTATSTGGTAGDTTMTSDAASAELRMQQVSLGFVSAYVLVRGNEATIVDTGTPDSREAILDGLDALSVGPAMVRHVVLTHNHGDHIGGLAGLEPDLTNATVHAGAADIGAVETSLALAELADGDEVFGMGVIGTPGHTPGSISVFDTASGILVAGDAVGGDGEGGLTGSNPEFTADPQQAADSIAKLAKLMATTVAFGHGGPPVTDDVTDKLEGLA